MLLALAITTLVLNKSRYICIHMCNSINCYCFLLTYYLQIDKYYPEYYIFIF